MTKDRTVEDYGRKKRSYTNLALTRTQVSIRLQIDESNNTGIQTVGKRRC